MLSMMCWAPVHQSSESPVRVGERRVVSILWRVFMEAPLENAILWRKGRRLCDFVTTEAVCWREVSLLSIVMPIKEDSVLACNDGVP